jgi:hypothetical protein
MIRCRSKIAFLFFTASLLLMPVIPSFSFSVKGASDFNQSMQDLNAISLSPAFSTYLGGSSDESIRDVATDSNGNVYVAGGTNSSNFPATSGSFDTSFNGTHDVIIAKFSPSGLLLWATYLGGPKYDRAYAIEVDSSGSVYVAGRAGTSFPTTSGAVQPAFGGDVNPETAYGQQDGFVTKLSPDGTRIIWSTYFGSDDREVIRDMDVDGQGNVSIATTSIRRTSRHITGGAFQSVRRGPSDGLVAKISANGSSIIYASYFGGSRDDGETPSIRADQAGNAYYLTHSNSTDAPVTANAFQPNFAGGTGVDLMLAKIAPDGRTLIYSSYLGGTAVDFTETHSLTVDLAGQAFVAITTKSTDMVTTPGAYQRSYAGSGGSSTGGNTNYPGDIYVAKVSADGSRLLAATYLGGRFGEGCEGVEVDAAGNVYFSGSTYSDNFPTTTGAFQVRMSGQADLFAVKLSADFSQLMFSTYLGGAGIDYGRCAFTDTSGNLYVAGMTSSTNWPVANAYQPFIRGTWDAMLAKFSAPSSSCTASLNPTSGSMPAAGGNGSITVSMPAGCNWTATSNAPWIGITSGASGSGNGGVGYSVSSNTSTSSRSGTISVAGHTFTVNQSAGSSSCSYTITPTSASFAAAGGTGNVGVSAGSGCGWTATSNASWIRITSGASGSGNGGVGYSVSSNTSTSSRSGTMTVAGRTFTVTQAGAQGPACSYTLSPTFATFGSLGGSSMVMVTVNNSNCVWQATSNVSWITITSGSQGKGGLVAYTVARNTTGGIRQGTRTIAGKTFAVYQK